MKSVCSTEALFRTGLIGGMYLLVVFLHSILLAAGEGREACAHGLPLYDVFHQQDRFGEFVKRLHEINPDSLIQMQTCLIMLTLLFHPQRLLILRRMMVFHGMLSLTRGILIFVTTLPSPNPMCRDRTREGGTTWGVILERAITLTLQVVVDPKKLGLRYEGITCCDLIISGHTCVLMVNIWLINTFLNHTLLVSFFWLLAGFSAFNIMHPSRHYTIDVLLTLIVSFALLSNYHAAIYFHSLHSASKDKIDRTTNQDEIENKDHRIELGFSLKPNTNANANAIAHSDQKGDVLYTCWLFLTSWIIWVEQPNVFNANGRKINLRQEIQYCLMRLCVNEKEKEGGGWWNLFWRSEPRYSAITLV